jgi:hypothetical protein
MRRRRIQPRPQEQTEAGRHRRTITSATVRQSLAAARNPGGTMRFRPSSAAHSVLRSSEQPNRCAVAAFTGREGTESGPQLAGGIAPAMPAASSRRRTKHCSSESFGPSRGDFLPPPPLADGLRTKSANFFLRVNPGFRRRCLCPARMAKAVSRPSSRAGTPLEHVIEKPIWRAHLRFRRFVHGGGATFRYLQGLTRCEASRVVRRGCATILRTRFVNSEDVFFLSAVVIGNAVPAIRAGADATTPATRL